MSLEKYRAYVIVCIILGIIGIGFSIWFLDFYGDRLSNFGWFTFFAILFGSIVGLIIAPIYLFIMKKKQISK